MDAAQFAGSIPANYDRYLGPYIFEAQADELVRRVAQLNPASVLELAAGTGIVTRKLAAQLDDAVRITATDLNPDMLEIAKTRLPADTAVSFGTANAMELPYQPGSFDSVVCQFGVMFFPDKPASFAQVRRVLSPDGHYLFSVWGSLDANPFARVAHDLMLRLFPEDPPGFYKVPFGYNNPQEIRAQLESAGFARSSIDEVNLTSQISSPEDLARGLVFGNPLQLELAERGADAEEVCAMAAEAIKSELGTQMPLRALLIQARPG